MLVSSVTETSVPTFGPNLTVAPARKFEPVMVTTVPPVVKPVGGAMLVMTGAIGDSTSPPTDDLGVGVADANFIHLHRKSAAGILKADASDVPTSNVVRV
jgi:hypothetical protein